MIAFHPTVMCVDDDPAIRESLLRELTESGYPTVTAPGAAEAMEMLMAARPRIIFCDWATPRSQGLDFCRRLRDRLDLPFIYFIMLTTPSQKPRLTEAFDAGVDDFLVKPVDPAELQARLHAARRVLELEERLRGGMETAQRLSRRLTSANARLKELASRDELTGLHNRREAMRRLNEMWKQSERYGQRLSLAIADIDRFKRINDQFGHAAGDAVLRHVAACLRDGMRECDLVCRIGGDEFLMLMPYTPLEPARQAAARCRELVRASPVEGIMAGVTIGTAERTPEMTGPHDLMRAADLALYELKALLPPDSRSVNPLILEATASVAPPEREDADAILPAQPPCRN